MVQENAGETVSLSVIIPCYNEERSVKNTVRRLEETMNEIKKTNPAATHRFFQQNMAPAFESGDCRFEMQGVRKADDAS